MIVRILGEGQYEVSDDAVAGLNEIDDRVERAVAEEDQRALGEALAELHRAVVEAGSPLGDDVLADSDLILPAADATLADVRELLEDADDGLVPGP